MLATQWNNAVHSHIRASAQVCIGETSAAEARKLGFAEVRFPEKPGLQQWADEVATMWPTLNTS